MRLELAIRNKMQLLKKDWKEFLQNAYPELFFEINENEEQKDGQNKKINP